MTLRIFPPRLGLNDSRVTSIDYQTSGALLFKFMSSDVQEEGRFSRARNEFRIPVIVTLSDPYSRRTATVSEHQASSGLH